MQVIRVQDARSFGEKPASGLPPYGLADRELHGGRVREGRPVGRTSTPPAPARRFARTLGPVRRGRRRTRTGMRRRRARSPGPTPSAAWPSGQLPSKSMSARVAPGWTAFAAATDHATRGRARSSCRTRCSRPRDAGLPVAPAAAGAVVAAGSKTARRWRRRIPSPPACLSRTGRRTNARRFAAWPVRWRPWAGRRRPTACCRRSAAPRSSAVTGRLVWMAAAGRRVPVGVLRPASFLLQ